MKPFYVVINTENTEITENQRTEIGWIPSNVSALIMIDQKEMRFSIDMDFNIQAASLSRKPAAPCGSGE
jgi:hypothetical protein